MIDASSRVGGIDPLKAILGPQKALFNGSFQVGCLPNRQSNGDESRGASKSVLP
jgi:hypothetical protein